MQTILLSSTAEPRRGLFIRYIDAASPGRAIGDDVMYS
jgi:hypothetical protein